MILHYDIMSSLYFLYRRGRNAGRLAPTTQFSKGNFQFANPPKTKKASGFNSFLLFAFQKVYHPPLFRKSQPLLLQPDPDHNPDA